MKTQKKCIDILPHRGYIEDYETEGEKAGGTSPLKGAEGKTASRTGRDDKGGGGPSGHQPFRLDAGETYKGGEKGDIRSKEVDGLAGLCKLNILGRELSPTFDLLYREVITEGQKEVEFRPLSSHPIPSIREDYSGILEPCGSHRYICYLNERLDDKDLEITAAHEMYHVILDAEGYPHARCFLSDKQPQYQLCYKICLSVGSAILDREINGKLYRCWNYNIWDKREREGREILEKLKKKQPLPGFKTLDGCLLALKSMNVKYYCSNGLALAIELQIERINPELRAIGLELRSLVEEHGHDSPAKATRSMEAVRNKLEIGGFCRIVVPGEESDMVL